MLNKIDLPVGKNGNPSEVHIGDRNAIGVDTNGTSEFAFAQAQLNAPMVALSERVAGMKPVITDTVGAMVGFLHGNGNGDLSLNTSKEIGNLSDLGTGLMLWVNIPIMLIFGATAMAAWHGYFKRIKSGDIQTTAKSE